MNLILAATFSALTGVTCRTVELPALKLVDDTDACFQTVVRAYVVSCRLRDERVANVINERIAKATLDAVEYEAAKETAAKPQPAPPANCDQRPEENEASCEEPYGVSDVLSFSCRTLNESRRTTSDPWAITFRVTGSKVEELKIEDLLVSKAAVPRLWDAVTADLKSQFVAAGFDPAELLDDASTASQKYQAFSLTPAGLAIDFAYAFGSRYIEVDLPYEDLRGILKARYLGKPHTGSARKR